MHNLETYFFSQKMIIFGAIGLLLGFAVAIALIYNQLVRTRIRRDEAWSQIDVQLKRRADLIPNLVNTVKGYKEYEESTFAKITNLRSTIMNPEASHNERLRANDEINSIFTKIFAVVENYPELKASANFLSLQEELANTENKVAYARQLYNGMVSYYNSLVKTFPTNLVAKMGGFQESAFIDIPQVDREVPKVAF